MRVKFTIPYDSGEIECKSAHFDIVSRDEDPQAFDEAKDYLDDVLVGAFNAEGFIFDESGEDEDDMGDTLLASWVVYAQRDLSHAEAKTLASRLTSEANDVMRDLE